ncbi:hypothetical protein CFE70_007065 [Pyrenophora teres f. teres 0-1]|uniref:Uncharacterized protein n=2 Tax=Pyrenophora teres f. teres TaxID=97479 RepID=E3S166_PYRTT|nr:hypothetical protein PTT_15917 [Pyrenophora teres f. teres 0-1]KAE8835038.1 hypothetical protein PTNB85_06371 [Pyrenophora teres f. teres]KAE8843486.1 hypothetical protein HRS9122_04589 [Pyrenophora teres f. teres]KAE8856726.1 hypothetical protein PTNB73_09448 [Pyrenophora teres f. teres]KAK1908429.1 hypothetical protein P3342_009278 [Pyrenophora teres f. teres]
MVNPKRMSEIFASSSEKDANATTATPPYSSEGPTLPIIGAQEGAVKVTDPKKPDKKRKAQDDIGGTPTKKPSQPQSPPTIHPSLYEPWTRLPAELRKLLETQKHIRGAQNVVAVVFSKNQNIKSGINKLKTYLGAYKDPASTVDMPDALKEEDLVIAVSAQGEGTTKLVGIVDMVRRIVTPNGKEEGNGKVEPWWMYTMLTSVEVERKTKSSEAVGKNTEEAKKSKVSQEEEEETFEPMEVDGHEAQATTIGEDSIQTKKVPVLTIWMTKKKIPALRNAFGEHSFPVLKLPEESD